MVASFSSFLFHFLTFQIEFHFLHYMKPVEVSQGENQNYCKYFSMPVEPTSMSRVMFDRLASPKI